MIILFFSFVKGKVLVQAAKNLSAKKWLTNLLWRAGSFLDIKKSQQQNEVVLKFINYLEKLFINQYWWYANNFQNN